MASWVAEFFCGGNLLWMPVYKRRLKEGSSLTAVWSDWFRHNTFSTTAGTFDQPFAAPLHSRNRMSAALTAKINSRKLWMIAND